jgi:hypothetical protein
LLFRNLHARGAALTLAAISAALGLNLNLSAATVKGTVLDRFTGRALARAEVKLMPVSGTAGNQQALFTSVAGNFEFGDVRPGYYLLSAARRGFAAAWYGQKAWNSAAVPIVIADERDELNLPLYPRRLGAISGTVWDENEIGISGVKVAAYRASRPPQLVAEAQADDRGFFRIGELEPGEYFIRSAGHRLPGGDGLLPAFFKNTVELDRAWPIETQLEEEAADRNFRPEVGELYELSGEIVFPKAEVTIELVSPLERIRTRSGDGGGFRFPNVAPGVYELFAEGVLADRYRIERFSAYRMVSIDNGNEHLRFGLDPLSRVSLKVEDQDANPVPIEQVVTLIRRLDLAGALAPKTVTGQTAELAAGRWEIAVLPRGGRYTAAIDGPSLVPGRGDGWIEFKLLGRRDLAIKAIVSPNAASIRGKVTSGAGRPVGGAPVYLRAVNLPPEKRVVDPRGTRTSPGGEYRFTGLAPGQYRLMSSFEFAAPDDGQMTAARAAEVSVRESEEREQNLELFVLR